MKVFMRAIEVIAWFNYKGKLTPIKFQMLSEDNEKLTIKVDQIQFQEEEKLAGNRMFIYRCQSTIEGVEKIYELKYEINTCKWFLYKM